MSRSTRLLTPVITPHLRRDLSARFFSGNSSTLSSRITLTHTPYRQNSRHSLSRNRNITAFALSADRHKSDPFPTVMDSDAALHSPETGSSVVDEFLNKANFNTDSVNDSIPGVDDVRNDFVPVNGEEEDDGSEQRKVLPEELSRSVMALSSESTAEGGYCDVYLIGTAHVFQESCREVQAVISFLKPQVVFLQLCASRVAVLTPQNLKVPSMKEMVEMWKKKHNLFGIFYSYFLAKVANKLEVFPGSEFRVAYEEAMKYGGKVILSDRPVNDMIDGDLCEQFSTLPLNLQRKIVDELDRTPGEILKGLEEMRNNVI